MEAIITAASVASMFMSLASSPADNGFAYNAVWNGEKIEQIYVYSKNQNLLSHKLRYMYEYDSMNRISKKTAMTWNYFDGEWENAYELNYTYGLSGYSLEQNCWNEVTCSFDKKKSKMVYDMLGADVMAVNIYTWDAVLNEYTVSDNMLVMHPVDKVLLALNKKIEE